MAGHSKWNNIKNRKGAVDAKRALAFTQVAKLIKTAVKEGKSADPNFNPGLRTVIDKARAVNMPKDKIDRAIERASGKTASGVVLHEVMYEGFGSAGEAYLVMGVTDNLNRTASEIKAIFGKHAATLTGSGSARFLFTLTPDHEYRPSQPQVITDPELADRIRQLCEVLSQHEDIDEVVVSVTLPEISEESD